jgi:hypothetical protein
MTTTSDDDQLPLCHLLLMMMRLTMMTMMTMMMTMTMMLTTMMMVWHLLQRSGQPLHV